MKENTPWILTYMLLVAAFAYITGWISGETDQPLQMCRGEGR
jgi:hypothetical protein